MGGYSDPSHSRARSAYVDVGGRQVHVRLAGPDDGIPVVLLHQTPRSWDEYAELIPLLADAGHRVVAVDTPGFGASDPPAEHSIEAYADGVLGALDGFGVDEADVLGHHTGGVVAVEVAARAPELVRRLVLSSTPHADAAFRERRRGKFSVDAVQRAPDGSHLQALWDGRAAFYPADRPDVLERFVRDALTAGAAGSTGGHGAVGAYRMEERLPLVRARTLVLGSDADPFAFPDFRPLADALRAAGAAVDTAVVPGGTVAVMEQCPDEVARAVLAFLH